MTVNIERAPDSATYAGAWDLEVEAIRQEARRRFVPFVHRHSLPGARERDRTLTPVSRELVREAGDAGIVGFSLPVEVGGEGRDKFAWGIVLEELTYADTDPALWTILDISIGVLELLIRAGRDDLVERYGARLRSGASLGSIAIYEDRDPYDYRSTARQCPDGSWEVNALKPFIAGARMADLFLLYARDVASNDMLAFLVERSDPGVSTARLETPGLRTLGFGKLTLHDARLPGDRLVWDSDALSHMNAYARNRRLMTAASLLGGMAGHVDRVVEHLSTRTRGGKLVIDYPNVERSVGEMRVLVESTRALVHRALNGTRGARDGYFDAIATAAKHHTCEAAIRVGEIVMNLTGGQSYQSLRPWERFSRDAIGLLGGQGSQEILLIQLGQRTIVGCEGVGLQYAAMERTSARIGEAWTALGVLRAALETGLAARLDTPITAAALAGAVALPPGRASATLDVLVGATLVERDGDAYRATEQLQRMAGDDPDGVGETLRSLFEHGDAAVEAARRGELDRFAIEGLATAGEAANAALPPRLAAGRALPALAVALELGLLDDPAALRDPAAEDLCELLATPGLLHRDEDGAALVAPALRDLLIAHAPRRVLEGQMALALEASDPLQGVLEPTGDPWHPSTAPALCELIVGRHLVDMEGLDEALEEPGAAALQLGPGADHRADELSRWQPRIPIDASTEPDRVPTEAFDWAWIAAEPLGREELEVALRRAFAALRPGGWAVVVTPAPPGRDIGAAVSRLRTAMRGGDPERTADDVTAAARAAGLTLVRPLADAPGAASTVLAARKPPSGGGGPA